MIHLIFPLLDKLNVQNPENAFRYDNVSSVVTLMDQSNVSWVILMIFKASQKSKNALKITDNNGLNHTRKRIVVNNRIYSMFDAFWQNYLYRFPCERDILFNQVIPNDKSLFTFMYLCTVSLPKAILMRYVAKKDLSTCA